MFRFTNVQYTEIGRTLAQCNDNVSLACRRYREVFVISVSGRKMLAATQRLRDYGSFQPPTAIDRGANPTRTTRQQDRILDYFDEHPDTSTRGIAPVFDCSHMFVWRTLRGDAERPYHLRKCQELTEHDYEPRIQFCTWLTENWQRNILWTDKSTFTRVGMYNQHSIHIWMHENPHACRVNSYQHRYSLNVWAGQIGTHILGPVFLSRLNGDTYYQFLTETLPELLEDIPLLKEYVFSA